jgi:transketolase
VRKAFCEGLLKEQAREEFVFLTGDLGFQALEPLRSALGRRFLNAGVAEQNMVSVAAGLVRQGFRPWLYSISPFLYARALEQIRNDVCLHQLPVVLVGNGGGYGYGVMGSTHHALEDYGVLLTLSGMEAMIPAFDNDLISLVPMMFKTPGPCYLRLGVGEQPKDWRPPEFAPWRKLTSGGGGVLIAVGPLAGALWEPCQLLSETMRPNLWCLSQLPLGELPEQLLREVSQCSRLLILEEHVAQGSAGQSIMTELFKRQCVPSVVRHKVASGYPSGRYGSQRFHRAECGLDALSVVSFFSGEDRA